MNMPNGNQINASLRHVVSFAMGAVTFAATLNFVSPEQANILTKSITEIGQSLGNLAVALGPVITIVAGYFASRAASPMEQIKSVAANPTVAQVVVKDEAVAQSIPSDKVVAK